MWAVGIFDTTRQPADDRVAYIVLVEFRIFSLGWDVAAHDGIFVANLLEGSVPLFDATLYVRLPLCWNLRAKVVRDRSDRLGESRAWILLL